MNANGNVQMQWSETDLRLNSLLITEFKLCASNSFAGILLLLLLLACVFFLLHGVRRCTISFSVLFSCSRLHYFLCNFLQCQNILQSAPISIVKLLHRHWTAFNQPTQWFRSPSNTHNHTLLQSWLNGSIMLQFVRKFYLCFFSFLFYQNDT